MPDQTRARAARKTPSERAVENLATADRIVSRLSKRYEQLEAELTQVRSDLDQAIRRRGYALSNPDLPAEFAQQGNTEPDPLEEPENADDRDEGLAQIEAQQEHASTSVPPWEREPDDDQR